MSLTGALEQVENTITGGASQCHTLLAVSKALDKGGFKTLMQIDKSMGWFNWRLDSAVDYKMHS